MNLTFGGKIKEARKAKHFTQKQLAEKIGAKHNSVSDWENNKNKPDPDTIELLCGVLDITPNYLLSLETVEFSPVEKLLIKKYRSLDPHGKDMVDTVLNKEFDRCQSIKKAEIPPLPDRSYLDPVAAHERTDIEVTDEMRQYDDELMRNDDVWK